MNRIPKTALINLALMLLMTACLATPQSARVAQNSTTHNELPTLDTAHRTPIATSTAYPTPTLAATLTLAPTPTPVVIIATPYIVSTMDPSQSTEGNVTVKINNTLISSITIDCRGPQTLQLSLVGNEQRTIQITSGTYSCKIKIKNSGHELNSTKLFLPGYVYEWKIYLK